MPAKTKTQIVPATQPGSREEMIAQLKAQGIAVQSDLIEQGVMADKPSAWTAADFANRFMLIDTATVTAEKYHDKRASKQLEAIRMTVTDPETGETKLFMSAAESLVSWYHEQFSPMADQLPRRLAVFVEAVPHSSGDPNRMVYTFR